MQIQSKKNLKTETETFVSSFWLHWISFNKKNLVLVLVKSKYIYVARLEMLYYIIVNILD